MRILDTFEKSFEQSINFDKSMIFFNPNTPDVKRTTLSRLLKMKVVDNIDGYLSLPIPVGKKKLVVFQNIIDRVANRINSWSKRLLSNGEKRSSSKPSFSPSRPMLSRCSLSRMVLLIRFSPCSVGCGGG